MFLKNVIKNVFDMLQDEATKNGAEKTDIVPEDYEQTVATTELRQVLDLPYVNFFSVAMDISKSPSVPRYISHKFILPSDQTDYLTKLANRLLGEFNQTYEIEKITDARGEEINVKDHKKFLASLSLESVHYLKLIPTHNLIEIWSGRDIMDPKGACFSVYYKD